MQISQKVDVICEFKRDGTIIPLRIRLVDEDGEYQEYNVKSYKDVTKDSIARNAINVFICKVVSYEIERTLTLNFNAKDSAWWVSKVQ